MIVVSEEVCYWVSDKTGGTYFAGSGQGFGLTRDGILIAGVLFENYNGRSVSAHVAGIGNWLNRPFLQFCFGYAFNQLRVNKMIGLVDSNNAAALRFDHHLGFVTEAVIKDAGKTGDMHVLTMTRAQCRYLKG